MTLLIIFTVLSGVLTLVGVIGFIRLDGYSKWFMPSAIAMVFGILGVIVIGAIATQVNTDNHNDETVRICTEKGGVVSRDNHCFVDGHPVEFEPGVWQR